MIFCFYFGYNKKNQKYVFFPQKYVTHLKVIIVLRNELQAFEI